MLSENQQLKNSTYFWPMQNRNYKLLIYFIAGVIAITLAIQVYWNYKNYQSAKQQLVNETQISLDNAVDDYYSILAKKNTVGFVLKNNTQVDESSTALDSLFSKIDISNKGFKGLDSLKRNSIKSITIHKGVNRDSFTSAANEHNNSKMQIFSGTEGEENEKADSLLHKWTSLTSRIVISINEDTLQIDKVDSLIKNQLTRKNIEVDYGFIYTQKDSVIQQINPQINKIALLSTTAKSTWLPGGSKLELFFTNETFTILKRNLVGILLSTLLIAAVIACLLFLLRIINRQKQLAEVKNDLISNITHEFKTPIATIGVALEGISNFNVENDPAKTKKYVQTSTVQLDKLNTMVEKLLETATLDGDDLQLNKEEVSIAELLQTLIKKHQSLAPQKEFTFESLGENIYIYADIFHLENALNNILDNAVKYGGNLIKVAVEAKNREILIKIADNGNELNSAQAKQIFEKFYRVPKGNTHNIKGFGIGLYYTKKIIEKHGGTISVVINSNTNFIITIPNA